MIRTRRAGLFIAAIMAVLCGQSLAQAQSVLRCGPFTQAVLDQPAPRVANWPVQEFEKINAAVKTQPHRVLFLGDSLTERFDPELWRQHWLTTNSLTPWPKRFRPGWGETQSSSSRRNSDCSCEGKVARLRHWMAW